MDADQFRQFMEVQNAALLSLTKTLTEMKTNMNSGGIKIEDIPANTNIPWPNPMRVDVGDDRDNYDDFIDGWENYCMATGIDKKNDLQKTGILMKAIGSSAIKKYGFQLSDDDKNNTADFIAKIRTMIYSKANVTMDRYNFFTSKQHQGEKFIDFYNRIKQFAKRCNFAALNDQLLCHQIIVGVCDNGVRKKLLETPKIYEDLPKTVQICETSESTHEQLREMSADAHDKPVCAIASTSSGATSEKRKCKFCGLWHVFEKGACTAYGKTCAVCKGRNHSEKVCKKRKSKNQSSSVNEIQQSDSVSSDDSDSIVIAKVDVDNVNNRVEADLNLKFNDKWINVKCMLDTGSNACLMGYEQYKTLMNGNESKIIPSRHTLVDFSGNVIHSIGQARVPCRLRDKKYCITFQIVKKNHGALLSAKACSTLGLIRTTSHEEVVHKIPITKSHQDIDEMLSKDAIDQLRHEALAITHEFDDVFSGYGLLAGEVDLEIGESIRPRIQSARRTPNSTGVS